MWEAVDDNGNGRMDKEEYVCLHRKLLLVLRGKDGMTEEQMTSLALDEWSEDTRRRGNRHMVKTDFCDAMFRLVDHWTDQVC